MRFLGSKKNKEEALFDYRDGHDMDDIDEDSSYGPAPPPPPMSDDEMPEKDDPPQVESHDEDDMYPDDNYTDDEEEEEEYRNEDRQVREAHEDDQDYDDEQSLEIPPTSIVQRMVDRDRSSNNESKGIPNLFWIISVCCCLILLSIITGVGFGTGAFFEKGSFGP